VEEKKKVSKLLTGNGQNWKKKKRAQGTKNNPPVWGLGGSVTGGQNGEVLKSAPGAGLLSQVWKKGRRNDGFQHATEKVVAVRSKGRSLKRNGMAAK